MNTMLTHETVKSRLYKWIQPYSVFNQLERTSSVTQAQKEQGRATYSEISIHSLHNVAVNSSAVSSMEPGQIKDWTEGGVFLVIKASSEESGQLLYLQSEVFIASRRHILNVIIYHWAVIALLEHKVAVSFVNLLAWTAVWCFSQQLRVFL